MILFPDEKTLRTIYQDLQNHHRSKSEVLKNSIQERLNKSLMNYYSSLNRSLSFLQDKDIDRYRNKV